MYDTKYVLSLSKLQTSDSRLFFITKSCYVNGGARLGREGRFGVDVFVEYIVLYIYIYTGRASYIYVHKAMCYTMVTTSPTRWLKVGISENGSTA